MTGDETKSAQCSARRAEVERLKAERDQARKDAVAAYDGDRSDELDERVRGYEGKPSKAELAERERLACD